MELREKVNKEIKATIVPEIRKSGFKGSFPHFRRMYDNGRIDYLSFQFNRYGNSFVVELAVAYPYKGQEGNFYYWDEITAEFLKKSNYSYTKERLRIEPKNGEWFEFNESNYTEIVKSAQKTVLSSMRYFDDREASEEL